MKTLSILRHGKSSWEHIYISDIDRPLLEKGIFRTQKVAKYMKVKGLLPDCIITSNAARAMQTAHIVIEELKLSLTPQISKKLYPGSVDEIVQLISALDNNTKHAMVVGHNPVFTDLVMHLSENLNIEWLPTSGLVTLKFKITEWKSILGLKGECIHYVKPKEISEL